MSAPSPSERFATAGRFASSPIKTSSFAEASRASASEGLRTRSGGFGTVSSKETPRQASLKMNVDPLAALTEIKSNLLGGYTGKFSETVSGIRGTLRGRWDVPRVAEDAMKNLPLKERWKAREGPLSTGGGGGYFGSGKPTGTLQSGVGEFGTTVRSGRGGQLLEIRSLSSGLSGQEQAPKPAALELYPRTRPRMYEAEYEYEPRRLPEGMQRPQGETGQSVTPMERAQLRVSAVNVLPTVGLKTSQMSEVLSKRAQELSSISRTEMDVLARQAAGVVTEQKQRSIVTPVLALDVFAIQKPMQEQRRVPVSLTEQRVRLETAPMYDMFQVPRATVTVAPRMTTTTEPVIVTTPRYTITPTPLIPPILPGFSLPGGGSYTSGTLKRGRKFTETLGFFVGPRTNLFAKKKIRGKK